MLVCPQCQCKNPLNHKFCQQCGISLTQKVCPECGTQTELSSLNCHQCGARTGKTWWGIIQAKTQGVTPPEEVKSESESTEVAHDELFVINPAMSQDSDLPSEAETLDLLNGLEEEEKTPESETADDTAEPEEVGEAIETPPAIATDEAFETLPSAVFVEESETVVETAVADVLTKEELPSTLKGSPVATLGETPRPHWLRETPETPETIESPSAFTNGDYLDDRQRYQLIELMAGMTGSSELEGSVLDSQPLQMSPLLTSVSADLGSLRSGSTTVFQSPMIPPAIAEPYLQLRAQWSPMIPAIHDAWEDEDYSILLIEERSAFPKLIDHCQQIEPVEPLDIPQMLQWLREMTQLWQVLTPWNCTQSLLKIDNLLLDSGSIRLQRLYTDPTDSPSLAELGKVWQQLLPPTLLSPEEDGEVSSDPNLIQLVNDVVNEKILTPDKLLATIEQIADPVDDDDFNEADDTIIMSPSLQNVDAVGATDVGHQRSHNEDDFAIDIQISKRQTKSDRSVEFRGLYIVCDGMGGHEGGEVASALAVKTLRQYFATHWENELMLPDEGSIRQAVLSANQAIYDLNQEDRRSGSGRMGTTLVMALVNNDQIAVAHVGDSRLYRFTQSQGLEQITVDHEVGQREIQRGLDPKIAYSRPDAYQLTQALGPRPENFVQPDIQFLAIEEDSLFIVASDGLTDNDLLENHVSSHLEPLLNSEADLNQGVKELIALGNDYNGHDNITAIVIQAIVKRSQKPGF